MPSKDKIKVARVGRKWYRENKALVARRKKLRMAHRAAWLRSYKGILSCVICDMSFNGRPECCDFHHLDPSTKVDRVGQLAHASLRAMLSEILKCIPVCANCHRTMHSLGEP